MNRKRIDSYIIRTRDINPDSSVREIEVQRRDENGQLSIRTYRATSHRRYHIKAAADVTWGRI